MERGKYIFSRTKGEVVFVNHFDRYAYIIIAIISSAYLLTGYPNSIKGILLILVLVVPFLILFVYHFEKVAYKLVFDLHEGNVEFHMFRNKGVAIKKIDDIKKVYNGGYITFVLQGDEKIIWKKRSSEEELINLLKRITIVQKGGLF